MPSINQIADWQDNIQFGKEGTYGTLATPLLVWGAIGAPEVDPGPEFIDAGEGGSGTSERFLTEFAVGKKQASVSWSSRASDSRVYMALRSLAQSEPTKAGAAPFNFTWSAATATKFPWIVQPATNLGISIVVSQLDGLAGASPQFLGAICESFSLESEEGGFVKMACKWRGTTATLATSAAAGTLYAGNQWSHYNILLQLAGTAQFPSKFKLEVMNNLVPFYGTAQTPQDLVLGQMGIKGSFSLPYKGVGLTEYGKFLARTNSVLIVDYVKTSTSADGNLMGTFDITYSGAKLVESNGLKMIDFEFQQAKNATATSFKIYATADLSL